MGINLRTRFGACNRPDLSEWLLLLFTGYFSRGGEICGERKGQAAEPGREGAGRGPKGEAAFEPAGYSNGEIPQSRHAFRRQDAKQTEQSEGFAS